MKICYGRVKKQVQQECIFRFLGEFALLWKLLTLQIGMNMCLPGL